MSTVRMYYDLCQQGIYLDCDDRNCCVRDSRRNGINSVLLEYHLERIEIYSTRRSVTPEELVDVSLTETKEFRHPWEAFGTQINVADPERSQWFVWFESQSPQALESFEVIYREVQFGLAYRVCQIVLGPDKGDCVCLPSHEERVVLNGSVYQYLDPNQLTFVRKHKA